MKSKHLWGILSVILFMLTSLVTPTYAYSPAIHNIDITVELDENGTAKVTEVWDVTVASGTEWYLVQGELGDIEIQDFKVTDETGQSYLVEENWNIDGTLEEKAGRAGIVKTGDQSLELCWGVGSYGDHSFTVQYTMTNFVKKFEDYNGFNQRLISDQLSSVPQHVKVTIKGQEPFTPDTTKIWAFGFPGEVFVNNGVIEAESAESLNNASYVTIMARFEPEMFDPTSIRDESFEVMKERAFVGSSYENDTNNEEASYQNTSYQDTSYQGTNYKDTLIIIVEALYDLLIKSNGPVILIIIIFCVMARINRSRVKSKGDAQTPYGCCIVEGYRVPSHHVEYCREVPFEGELPAAYWAFNKTKLLASEGSVIGVYLLKWIKNGTVRLCDTKKQGLKGLMGSTEQAILFQGSTSYLEPGETKLYNILREAAGKNGILQSKEFYKWARRHYDQVESALGSIKNDGRARCLQLDAIISAPQPALFGLFNINKDFFTPKGQHLLSQAVGFRKYLLDFTLINEREPSDIHLWDSYLNFAVLFGIADQVAKSFKHLYPDYFTQPDYGFQSSDDFLRTMIVIDVISRSGEEGARDGRHAAESSSSDGGGGSSSFDGGGGDSSGGGSGGGSR